MKRNFTPKRIFRNHFVMIHSFKMIGVYVPLLITYFNLNK
jgi:hypothetical protein